MKAIDAKVAMINAQIAAEEEKELMENGNFYFSSDFSSDFSSSEEEEEDEDDDSDQLFVPIKSSKPKLRPRGKPKPKPKTGAVAASECTLLNLSEVLESHRMPNGLYLCPLCVEQGN